MAVNCTAPIKVNQNLGQTVFLTSPTHIVLRPTGAIDIESTAPLGADFERGWNKLPDELKVRSLAFNLVRKKAISSSHYYFDDNDGFPPDTENQFLDHLRMTSEIAGLAQEIRN
ncbi:hypothetical protein BDV96DRAFT_647265 [Lophiotrema nucula]|uniref:Uncharacterized protein n=1 Tax=Lophiotrema nucula TaxID=690887 RepID=A0A6A5Z508_9PLEO|nr:hypothetical protein BDV96DRAFT_647265 [Lophiotrema nucula]